MAKYGGIEKSLQKKLRPPYVLSNTKYSEWQQQENIGGLGFILLQNPRNRKQVSLDFSLSSALELPEKLGEAGALFVIEVVRRVALRPRGRPYG